MRAVNLLPSGSESRKSFRKEDPAVVVGSALGVVVLFALVVGFMVVHSKVNAEQKKLTMAQTELAKLSLVKKPVVVTKPVVTKPIIAPPAVTSEEQPRLAAITTAMSTRIAWDRILREFSLVLPSDVTLKGLTLTAPAAPVAQMAGSPAAPAAQGLNITGYRLLSRRRGTPAVAADAHPRPHRCHLVVQHGVAGGRPASSSASAPASRAHPRCRPLPAPVVPTDTTTTAGASS